MAGKLLNRCSTSVVIWTMQIKTTRRYYCTSTRTLKIKHQCWQGRGATWSSHTVGGNVHWSHQFGKPLEIVSLNPYGPASPFCIRHLLGTSSAPLASPCCGGLGYFSSHFKDNLPAPAITPGAFLLPPRCEVMRGQPGTHNLQPKMQGEWTHFGLSFDDGRWEPVDKFFPIPRPRLTVTSHVHSKAFCERIPQVQHSDAFGARWWPAQKLILTSALLPSCLILFLLSLDSQQLHPLIKKHPLSFCLRLRFWRAQAKIPSQVQTQQK